ncbi:hypothetical protein BOX08_gp42 [Pseudoalteromonas phage BS5]|uniref:hypothetical protein n=1 Tax=Pseudoalteromonas phage BS5 TaxID=1874539 RepID=UPI00081985AF|nr:hypothetical protein BOX08_gp42 [Pseudoalteromonas phage BS5]ANY29607.1 hypothetical protein [Pseudoalteromonas phage BS5]
MSMNLSYYRRQIKKIEDKIKNSNDISDKDFMHALKEIENYERAIRQAEPTGVDKYLK